MFNEGMLNVYKVDEEVKVGSWNGKPLYRQVKIFKLETSNQNTGVVREYDFYHNIPNMESYLNISALFRNGMRIPYLSTYGGVTTICSFTNEKFSIRVVDDNWSREFYAIMEYTKTTD